MHLAADYSRLRNRSADGWRLRAYAAIFLGLVLFLSIFFPFSTGSAEQDTISCRLSGVPRFPWDDYGFGADMAQGLSITLGAGNFTFAEAKSIDVAWDLIVGRGGQVLVTCLSYPVFRRVLLRILEDKAVTFSSFGAIALQGVSPSSLWTLLGISCPGRDRRLQSDTPNWRWPLLLLSFLYILTFPTLLSVMTGYQSISHAYVQLPTTENMVPTTALVVPDAVVVNGSRVGLPDNYSIFEDSQPGLYDALSSYAQGISDDYVLDHTPEDEHSQAYNRSSNATLLDSDHVPPIWTCSYYISVDSKTQNRLPWVGSSTIVINGTNHTLSSPPLTIFTRSFTPPHSLGLRATHGYPMAYNGTVLDPAWLQQETVCEPTSAYAWGFSTALLFLFSLFSLLFAFAMLLLDTDVYRHCRAARLKLPTNMYRDAIDLTLELQSQLGDNVVAMPADELLELVESKRGAISLERSEYPEIPLSHTDEKTFGHLPGKIRSSGTQVRYFPLQGPSPAAAHLVPKKKVRELIVV